MSAEVSVRYVDGTRGSGLAEEWRSLRSDGLDGFIFTEDGRSVSFEGASLYWCRRTERGWASGSATIGYEGPITEVIGTSEHVAHRYLPDLLHADVKFGAWWPDVEGVLHGEDLLPR